MYIGFGFICPGFELSFSKISASTTIQWKWIIFRLWCSQHWEIIYKRVHRLHRSSISPVLLPQTFTLQKKLKAGQRGLNSLDVLDKREYN